MLLKRADIEITTTLTFLFTDIEFIGDLNNFKILRFDWNNLNYVEDIPFIPGKFNCGGFKSFYLKGTAYAFAKKKYKTRKFFLKAIHF